MRKLLDCRKMQEADAYTINNMGVPSLVLMERAAMGVVEEIVKDNPERILVVCGNGNNGGDGVAVGRILYLKGYEAHIYFPGNPSKFSEETAIQKKIADNYHVPVVNNPNWCEYTTIVDSIFGVGLSREVTGIYRDTIEKMNQCTGKIFAVDIASGICGDCGIIMGAAVKADVTVTFAYEKPGQYLYPGRKYCGNIIVKDIGVYTQKNKGDCFLTETKDLKDLPARDAGGNKGTFGKVLVVAGSDNMYGAAYLSGRAALLSGAGMVKMHTEMGGEAIIHTLFPEALLSTDQQGEADESLWEDNLRWADVVVIGPGLGQGSRGKALMSFYLTNCIKPMVIDADGLNILSKNMTLLPKDRKNIVLTPHVGEMSRITGKSAKDIKMDLLTAARELSAREKLTCVLKDATTVVAYPDGTAFLNDSGNNGMATAGSGDVLSGVIAGLMAQDAAPVESAYLGVYLHGAAGDKAKDAFGARSITATGILEKLPAVLKNY